LPVHPEGSIHCFQTSYMVILSFRLNNDLFLWGYGELLTSSLALLFNQGKLWHVYKTMVYNSLI